MVLTTGFLRGPVGAGLENDPQDVIGVKRRLRDIGLYRPPPEGIGDDIDAEFEKAVRAFQESAGLRVDGLLEPGGETERNLAAEKNSHSAALDSELRARRARDKIGLPTDRGKQDGMPDRNWRDPRTSGTTRAELTFRNDKSGRSLFINSVETRRDNVTPTRREREAARRMVRNAGPADIVALIPKPPKGQDVDETMLDEILTPLAEELEKPAPPGDPRDTTPLEDLWFEWAPPA